MKKFYILIFVISIILFTQNSWPVYQHTLHSGLSTSHIPYPLKEKWSYKGNPGPYFVVSGERVYAQDHSRVFCLENGSVLWTQKPGMTWGFPAVENSRLYTNVQEGFLCLDINTGTPLWKYEIPDTLPYSSPLIVDDCFIAGCSGHVWEPEAVDDTLRVVCLQKETGQLVWEMYTEGVVDKAPAYYDNIYINDKKNMYCLRTNGELIWKKELEWATFSSVSLDEERIFVGAERGIICLGIKSGESYWKFDCGEEIFNTPAVGHNRIFFGSPNGIFYCLHAETGKILWKIETESKIFSEAMIANKKVAFGTDDGVLYIVKAISGKILESIQLDESGITCLALSDNQLFVGQNNGVITCFEQGPFYYIWILILIVILGVAFIIWRIRKVQ